MEIHKRDNTLTDTEIPRERYLRNFVKRISTWMCTFSELTCRTSFGDDDGDDDGDNDNHDDNDDDDDKDDASDCI